MVPWRMLEGLAFRFLASEHGRRSPSSYVTSTEMNLPLVLSPQVLSPPGCLPTTAYSLHKCFHIVHTHSTSNAPFPLHTSSSSSHSLLILHVHTAPTSKTTPIDPPPHTPCSFLRLPALMIYSSPARAITVSGCIFPHPFIPLDCHFFDIISLFLGTLLQ